jgi:hypothetical protein
VFLRVVAGSKIFCIFPGLFPFPAHFKSEVIIVGYMNKEAS